MSTPMFEQYESLKSANPDAILLFRMGDFYEMFFDDAVVGARVLELTLTSRNPRDPQPIPMAGVPHHAAAGYIQRLVDAGHRVAIAEQVEDPALAKGLVRREVVRIVTPGVVLDPSTLDGHLANWLAAVAAVGTGGYALAFLDVSTGELRATLARQLPSARAELARFLPREVLLGPGVPEGALAEVLRGVRTSPVAAEVWGAEAALAEVRAALHPETAPGPDLPAIAAVLRYARDQLGGRVSNVHRVERYDASGHLVVDETTRRSLELFRTTLDNKRQGSLIATLDLAGTPMGSRRLADWLALPLLDRARIAERQVAVESLIEEAGARAAVRGGLARMADIARICARVAQRSASPRDLGALARTLSAAPAVIEPLAAIDALRAHLPSDLCADLREEFARTLVDDPPLTVSEGGILREGFSAELDHLIRLSVDGMKIMDDLQADEQKKTGISSLKVGRHKGFGFYIEVTNANLHRVPDRYLRKQTLSNCERFVTPELEEVEEQVVTADSRRKELETELFTALRSRVESQSARLLRLGDQLATLDALIALAEVAVRGRWTRPVVDDSRRLEIVGGRHPMVEAAAEERFVPNDVWLDPEEARSLVVLTGPNMAGKSTSLRMVAIVALLAHIGSFVPAESARIGWCDRVFTRVGAADDLRRGRSTFMVEMAETADILAHATERSLVVLDEIGRGTSTYDGLAIAWAVAEDLHDRVGCRALFATHYHELCELPRTLRGAVNLQVAVSEVGEEVVFLRKLVEGAASRSYGVQCARIAGIAGPVLERARDLLTRFEKPPLAAERQLGLFSAPAPPPEPKKSDALRAELAQIDPDALSPRDALAALYRLRGLL